MYRSRNFCGIFSKERNTPLDWDPPPLYLRFPYYHLLLLRCEVGIELNPRIPLHPLAFSADCLHIIPHFLASEKLTWVVRP